jgi:EAL domain-containing protein (putative c-di-GMP-specific phosphodiesterase class I)
MRVDVEGIETVKQLEIIQAINGNEVQGFLLGRPTSNPQSTLDSNNGSMYLRSELTTVRVTEA